MRLIPIVAAVLMASTAAIAQPYGDPSQQQGGPPEQQMAPDDQMQAPSDQQAPARGAGKRHGGKLAQRFEAANVTHDGRLTAEQAQAGHMGGVSKHFADIDADRKGYITMQDIKAWHRAMKQARAQPAAAPAQGSPGMAPQMAPQPQYQAPPQ